jgi:hypothetical protein
MYESIVDMFMALNAKDNIQSPVALSKVSSGGQHSRVILTKSDALAEWPAKERSPGELFM